MKFPNKYKKLKRNVVKNGRYKLVPIRFEDRFSIMQWRNEQLYHLRQPEPLNAEQQDKYFKNVVSSLFTNPEPTQILFSYLEDDVCIGYGGLVHINWADMNAEISFVLNTHLEHHFFKFHWVNYLDLIETIAFEDLNLNKIFTYAFDLRPLLYSALEERGFVKEAVLKNHVLFEEEHIDVVLHTKFNLLEDDTLHLHPASLSHVHKYFEWTNDSEVRKSSFSSDQVDWHDHFNWFKHKIESKDSLLYVLIFRKNAVGQVRLDKNEDYWILGYSIDKRYRKRKMAVRMLEALYSNHTDKKIIAYVKPTNIGSLKIFRKLKLSENTTSSEIIFRNY